MKDRLIYSSIFITFIITAAWVFYLAFTEPRDFKLILLGKDKACLLVDVRYQFKEEANQFKYWGKKNSGVITYHTRMIGEDMVPAKINGLEAGYKKIKNKRIYEYQISPDFLIRDEFVFASKSPLNLVPYVKECSQFKHKYKNQISIW